VAPRVHWTAAQAPSAPHGEIQMTLLQVVAGAGVGVVAGLMAVLVALATPPRRIALELQPHRAAAAIPDRAEDVSEAANTAPRRAAA
jgi:hypothetical protein